MAAASVTITWNTDVTNEAVRRATLRGIIKGANIVRNEVLRLIQQTPKTGRTYTRRGVTHQASAPGEPPASDTGTLVSKVVINIDAANLAATVQSTAIYGDALEFGTLRMAARPYMRVALENKKQEVEAAIAGEVAKELGK